MVDDDDDERRTDKDRRREHPSPSLNWSVSKVFVNVENKPIVRLWTEKIKCQAVGTKTINMTSYKLTEVDPNVSLYCKRR